jgi:hypothetical protein
MMTISYELAAALTGLGLVVGLILGFAIFSRVGVTSRMTVVPYSLEPMLWPPLEPGADYVYYSQLRNKRQRSVAAWCAEMFGADHAASVPQRALRMLEETLELAQAAGLDDAQAHHCVDHVYSRPPGDPAKELAQVGVVLLSVAEALGVNADAMEAAEVARVTSLPKEHWQRRNAEKNAAGLEVLK